MNTPRYLLRPTNDESADYASDIARRREIENEFNARADRHAARALATGRAPHVVRTKKLWK